MKKVLIVLGLIMIFAVSSLLSDVFITELADPNNDANARFIELYNNGVSSVDFTEGSGWKINKYTNGSLTVSQTLNLTGTIGASGFYLIAYNVSAGTFLSVYGLVADQLDAVSNGVAGANGDDTFELVDGTGAVVDFYGVQPIDDLTSTIWEYEDGRAERANGATTGKNPPVDADWNTWSDGAGGDVVETKDAPDDFDPGEWIGAAASPIITLSTTSLTNFSYVFGNGPSAEQSFTAEGSDLSANITLTPPTNYEISTGTGGAFSPTSPITLTHTGGTVATTTIYVRLKAGLSINSYNNENISATSTDATTKTISCDGAVTGTTPVEPTAGDLVITEVVGDDADATSDDGFMEIYNNTSSTINLNNVQARYYNSNPGDPSYTQNLSGSIEAGDYIVVTQNNTNFTTEYSFAADFSNGSFYFNGGDDGVDVYHTGNGVLDQFNDNGALVTAWSWSDANVFERTSTASGAVITNWTEITTGNGTPGAENVNSLPVTLSTFTAQYLNSKPTLYWQTQSEEDNMGWFIYRNTVEDFTSSEKISGMIQGHGTTTQPQSYIYEDAEQLQVEQTYYYWLESVDYSGTLHHFDMVVNITIPHSDEPGQNVAPPVAYEITADPSPFSYSTEITFAISQTSMVDVAIYNLKGQLVKSFDTVMTNADEEVSFQWNGKDDTGKTLSNGVYLYSVKVNGKDYATKQLILMK